MSCVNRNNIAMEKKEVWFHLIKINWHIFTSLDFVVSRAKSSEKLNKMVSKFFYHLDNVTLHSINLILSRE